MMNRFRLFFTTLLVMVGIWVHAQAVTIDVNRANGTFYKYNTMSNQAWNNRWVSTQNNPQVTFQASANNMTTTNDNGVDIYSGGSLQSTYTLSVSGAYRIARYTIEGTARNGDQTVTPTGGNATVFRTGVAQSMSVEANAASVSFVLSGSNTGLMATITVTLEPFVSTPPDATHRYRITNANQRGSLYYSPSASSFWIWSTGKNNSNTAAANYEWAFIPTGTTGEYYIYNIGRQRYIAPTTVGSYSDATGGKTWAFTPEKVAVTLTDMGGGTYSIKTSAGGNYLSMSNSYTGPVIDYYAAGDGGVPFVFENVGDFDPATIPAISEGLIAADMSAVQAYQTTGRGNLTPLVKLDITGSTLPVTLTSLSTTLKGSTAGLVNTVSVYATTGEEFYAETPVKLGEQTVGSGADLTVPLNHQLRSGLNHLWLAATVKEDATVGEMVDAAITAVTYISNEVSKSIDLTAVGNPDGEAKIFKVHSVPFVPTTDNCRFYRIPAMIVANDGSVIAVSDKRYNSSSDLGNHKIDVVVRRSTDGGRTWSNPVIMAEGDGTTNAAFGYGDVALAKAPNGDIIAVMAAGKNNLWDGIVNIGICISKDNGVTWSAVRDMTLSNFTDEISGTVNSFAQFSNFITSGRGITTKDGEVMFLGNVIYPGDRKTLHNHIFSSSDNGQSWTLRKESVYDGGDESKLVQRADGAILASIRQSGARGFNLGSSNGRQWAGQYRSTTLSGNACNADVLAYSDKLMLHTVIANVNSREDLKILASTNSGETWHEVYTIQPGYAAYSSMEKLANGDLAIIFEDASYGSNGYITTYVTLPKEMVEAFANNEWNDETTSWSQRIVDEYGKNFESGVNLYYSLTDASRNALQPTYSQLSGTCTPDEYFSFVDAVRNALKTGVKIPETGYYRIKSTKARTLYTYLAYGTEPTNGNTGLITVPATTGHDNISTVVKLTRLDNGKFTLSTQGLNVQEKPAANQLFQLSEAAGQEFSIDMVAGKPGVVGITAGGADGYLNETNFRTDGYNGVTCWNINDPASQWTIEDADFVNVPLTTMGEKSYATVCMPFAFDVENAQPATVVANTENATADYTTLAGTMPAAAPLLLVSDGVAAVAKLNIRNTEPAAISVANQLKGAFLAATPEKNACVLGETDGKGGFWIPATVGLQPANTAYLPLVGSGTGFAFNNMTTGIAMPNVADGCNDVKVVYDMQGRRLSKAVHGVNIINGKKIVVK